jgi:hypothetical protein
LCNTTKSGGRGPVRVNSLHYRSATLAAGSPQIADITSRKAQLAENS